MTIAEQNNPNYTQVVLDSIKTTVVPFRGVYLFTSDAGDAKARNYMFGQLGALARELAKNGTPVELVSVRDLFIQDEEEYKLNKDAIAALDDNCFYQLDLTEEIELSVHFMKWFSVIGIKLLGITFPLCKKQFLIATNTMQPEPGKYFSLSWLKAEQLFFLSRMTFHAQSNKMTLVRSIVHPSGANIDFNSVRDTNDVIDRSQLSAEGN